MYSILDQYFTSQTMSLHLQAGLPLAKKQGNPGAWTLFIENRVLSQAAFDELIATIYAEMKVSDQKKQEGLDENDSSFLEIDQPHHKVIQHGPYRIVIVYPPLAKKCEITVVRPLVRLRRTDYALEQRVQTLLQQQAQGILIAGSPGSGKTTFAQALIDTYVDAGKIIKTLESPRDLDVLPQVSQYSFSYGSHDQLRDILLLSRPDAVIYDEVRNQSDFLLFKDLRLTGIGLVGVMHATKPVDALQRFLGVIDMGVIPQVIDTIVYMKGGLITEILQLALVVKVPHGMLAADLARPVIVVSSFLTEEILYEVYSYGEQVVVIPIADIQTKIIEVAPLVRATAERFFFKKYGADVLVDFAGPSTIILTVPDRLKGEIIGRGGECVMRLEQELGCRIDVRTKQEEKEEIGRNRKKQQKKRK